MIKLKTLCLFITILIFSARTFATPTNFELRTHPGDSTRNNKGFIFGINMGAFFANKFHAGFYDGSPENVDSMGLVFTNYYYLQDIKRELSDTFRLLELPQNIKFQPAMQVGFYVKYNFDNNFGVFMQFNYAKLKAKDVFTMGIGPDPSYLTFDNIQMFSIIGTEERINIDIGVNKTFETSKTIQLFLEGGLNINNTRIKEHKIYIGSKDFSLINIYGTTPYAQNTQQQTYEPRLGGLGIGAFAGGGVRFVFNNKISLDPGFTFFWAQAKHVGYTAYKPHYAVYLRFCFQNLFGSSDN